MPRGHRRNLEFDDPAPPESPPITIEEATRRKLWGIFRVRKGTYVCSKPGVTPIGYEWVAWAVDEEAALRACVQRGRDDRFPKADRDQPRQLWRPPFAYDPQRPTFSCGHPRVVKNAYVSLDREECRTCRRERSRRWERKGRSHASQS